MANLESFAYIGIKSFIFKNKTTGLVECNLKHLVNLNLTDTMQEDFLRGGYGFEKLLTVFSNRETKLEGETATQTTDLIKIMSNSSSSVKTKNVQQIEEPELLGGKFTLKLSPSSGVPMDVMALDVNGKETKLSVGAPATNPSEYSITGKDVTCNTSVKKIRVYYVAQQEVETIEIKDITPKNWEAQGILVAKEIETGKLFKCVLDIPNCTVSPNFSSSFKNSDGSPDNVSLAINIMFDSGKGYSYSLNFVEEV